MVTPALGGRSTCEQVVAAATQAELAWLGSSTVLVTGSNTGIGRETALQLAKAGAHVVMACRSVAKGEAAKAALVQQSGLSEARLSVLAVDLSDLESVRACAAAVQAAAATRSGEWSKPLRCVVCNAGIFPAHVEKGKQGFDIGFVANHLGHWLLVQLLLPLLRANRPSKIVVVSSDSHFGPLMTKQVESKTELLKVVYSERKTIGLGEAAGVYGSTKLMNVLFAKRLHAREAANGVAVCSLHPGNLIATDVARDFGGFTQWIVKTLGSWFSKSLNQGASTTLFCVLLPHHTLEGLYFCDCKPKPCSKLATDKAADVLWELSQELVASVKPEPEQLASL
jgi:NAD(P)-dependent dehydrogenase (short-subunit alcohol dehydrogenase family)